MKDKIIAFFNGSYKIISIIMLTLWGMILLLSISYLVPSFKFLSTLIVMVGVIVYLLFLFFIYHKIGNLKEKTHNKIAILISIISFIILISWGLSHSSLPIYDLRFIVDKVKIMLHNETHIFGAVSNIPQFAHQNYFSEYPYQIPLFIMVYFVESIGKILFNAPEATMIIFNCFMTALSFYCVYKIIKELANSKMGIMGLILTATYLDFYLMASNYYTDVLCIPFATIGFYFLIKSEKLNSVKKYISLILGGILFGIATKMRVVASFLLIGYIVKYIYVYIINGNKKDNFKKMIINFTTLIVGFISIFLLHNILVNNYFKIEINKNETYPLTHFIMMGLNQDSNGSYYGADDTFTRLSQNKINDTIDVIKERLPKINLDFFIKKLANEWSGGLHYGAGVYQNVSKVDDSYPFLAGYNNIYLKIISQIMLVTIYLLFLVSIVYEIKKNNKDNSGQMTSIMIAIFGAIVFYLFWEAKNRYSWPFMEWIIIGASLSFDIVYNYCEKILSKKNKNYKNSSKIVGYTLISLVLLFLIDGFLEYSYKKTEIDVPRYIQYGYGWYFEPKDNEIEQYFMVNDTFNKIELAVNDENINKKITYKFELYNMEDELLYEKKFNTTTKKGTTAQIFAFKDIIVEEPTKFYFKIYSDEATVNNYLKFSAYTAENCVTKDDFYANYGYDIMPYGETYMNNKKVCHELTLKIYEHKLSNKIRKKYYIVFAGIILLITWFGVYKLLIKNKK